MKALSSSVLGLVFLFAAHADVAQADGLLDPFNLFGKKTKTTRKSSAFGSKNKGLSFPKLSLPKLQLPSTSKQGSRAASLDRKVRTNWISPKSVSARAEKAVENTTKSVGNVTTATYNATASALSPKKNIQRVQYLSEKLTDPFINYATPDGKNPNPSPWPSSWFKANPQPKQNDGRSNGWPRIPMNHNK